MRVLFCSHPGLSHSSPRAARLGLPHRGHEALVSIADCAAEAAGSGLEIVDVAPDFDMNAINERMATEHPDLMAAMSTTPMIEFYLLSLLNRQAEGCFMPVPYNGGTVASGRLPAPPTRRPRIAVSMGTTELQR